MAFSNGPSIVTSGLTLLLDAADRNSYPGSGTTWTDVSGNGNNGILTNGPTFSFANEGNIVFDGTNDYVNLGTGAKGIIQGQTNFTVGLTFQLNINDVLRGLIGTLRYGCGGNIGLVSNTGGSLVFFNDYGGNWPDPSGVCYSIGFNPGYVVPSTWIYAVATYNGVTTTVYGIKNGVLSVASGTAKSGSSNVFDYPFEIMKGSLYYSSGSVANAFVYNRALSQTEVLQNYNATKTRFGL